MLQVPLSAYVSMAAVGATGFVYWRYNVAVRTTLLKSERKIKQTTSSGIQECRALLKDMQGIWEADVKERQEQLRAVQLQNVEQTRSVARLDSAMKSCFE